MYLPTPPPWYTRPTFVAGIACFTVIVTILHGVAFISPYWGAFSISSLGITTTVNYGLWSKCTHIGTQGHVCIDWTSSTSSAAMKATQTFGVVGIILTIVATFMFVLLALKKLMSRYSVIAMVVMFFVSAGSNLLTIICFIAAFLISPDADWPSWSFIINVITSVVGGILGAYILLFAKKKRLMSKPKEKTVAKVCPPEVKSIPTPRKIKVKTIESPEVVNEEEIKRNKDLIDSKVF